MLPNLVNSHRYTILAIFSCTAILIYSVLLLKGNLVMIQLPSSKVGTLFKMQCRFIVLYLGTNTGILKEATFDSQAHLMCFFAFLCSLPLSLDLLFDGSGPTFWDLLIPF